MVYTAIFVIGSILLILTCLALWGRCIRLQEEKGEIIQSLEDFKEELPKRQIVLDQKYENRIDAFFLDGLNPEVAFTYLGREV